MNEIPREHLGTIAAADALLEDLYLSLRTRLTVWSKVTHQTPQARMGYVGQHLVSVVTGLPGGRSAARGYDLIGPGLSRYSEIKTCYRIDQLGSCRSCGAATSAVEVACPNCKSRDIDRKNDSKWLIAPKNESDMNNLFRPQYYFLVLFDYVKIADPREIQARIWRIDPTRIGFSTILVDYFMNIRSNSASKAPFNLWPFSLKFQLMEPTLIYSALVDETNKIKTLCFPNQGPPPTVTPLEPLGNFARSIALSPDVLATVARNLDVPPDSQPSELLQRIEDHRVAHGIPNETIVRELCLALYKGRLGDGRKWLPPQIRDLHGEPPID
jgi:hypothetical protein